MKITVEKSRPTKIIRVSQAKYLKDYVLRVSFSDGTERAVDFKPFLMKSTHPQVTKYRKESVFKKFTIIGGNIDWNDYELIFPIDDLYKGKI
jgi:hypothetical protein